MVNERSCCSFCDVFCANIQNCVMMLCFLFRSVFSPKQNGAAWIIIVQYVFYVHKKIQQHSRLFACPPTGGTRKIATTSSTKWEPFCPRVVSFYLLSKLPAHEENGGPKKSCSRQQPPRSGNFDFTYLCMPLFRAPAVFLIRHKK
jgi:hypothetical protein